MAVLKPVTFEVLLRPKGSTAAPQVVGEILVDYDFLTDTVPPLPPPVQPLPSPVEDEPKDA